ncbi:MAG TPA: TonB-dependent receptor [Bacteroidales bacterium]|nr:TonB-dependent receptor [Bacteroidales bacterium]
MVISRSKYIVLLLVMIPSTLFSQGTQENRLTREVKLYNPFKPFLSKENKINFFPDMNDTTVIEPEFQYSITTRSFMPEIKVKVISAARLQPDPLPKLYKGYLNVGFGNYFTPIGELSVTTERSRDNIMGFYAGHMSSFGKVKLDNNENVHAGYMDNTAKLFVTKLFRRTALKANLGFDHVRRTAYGYDLGIITPPDTRKDSLQIDYLNPSAKINFYSNRLDSSRMAYDAKIYYDLLYQTADHFQHMAGLEFSAGFDLKMFYGSATAGYEYYSFPDMIDSKPRHLVKFEPSINKITRAYAFRIGLKAITDSRNEYDELLPPEYKTNFYLYPDIRFQFKIIPSFVSFFVSLDGYHDNNQAASVIYKNPYVVIEATDGQILPSTDLYRIKPTDNKLRVMGGLLGSANESSTYKLVASYTLFEDMLFFGNDLINGRGFMPLYDNGELLNIKGEATVRLNSKLKLSATGNYFSYSMEVFEHPWYKPDWDAKISLSYNLRNKVLADAEFNGMGTRYARYGPMPYSILTEPTVEELPVYFSLNLGVEYRYTKILSFWTRLQNISFNRYYEWNFYPSQRFLFIAGFSYSL